MDTATEEKEAKRNRLVRAVSVLAWHCPDCGLMQIADKSSTHTGECRRCTSLFTVDVKARI